MDTRQSRTDRLTNLLEDVASAEQPLADYIDELEEMRDLIDMNLDAARCDQQRDV